ncbi:hypothetical protein FQN53_007834 [Emmonsiellopsis sp. PD_33]|nr:hypothetical protein FQN53_007834 [Emmonsiellopsis sp. PD_33]KAK2790960.1 hypothetical protein FQN51_002421 [Onygenales sp. PD_10]
MAVDRSPDIPALTDGSSILGDSIISIDNQEPLVVYSVPFDGEDEVDDGFVLLPRDQENEQLSSSGYLMGDQQSSPWHPPLEEIYDEGDDGYSGGQRSMSSSMLDSIIVECSEPSAEQLAGSMTSSRISRWSGSASLYLRHVGSCFDEMAELNPDSYPQTIDLM